MKKKFVIVAIFTVLLILSMSTVSVINAQTEETEKTTNKEKNIEEKNTKKCPLCNLKEKPTEEDINQLLELLKKEQTGRYQLNDLETHKLGWYPFKCVICGVMALIFLILPYPAAWGPYVTARTVFNCLWAQGPLP